MYPLKSISGKLFHQRRTQRFFYNFNNSLHVPSKKEKIKINSETYFNDKNIFKGRRRKLDCHHQILFSLVVAAGGAAKSQ